MDDMTMQPKSIPIEIQNITDNNIQAPKHETPYYKVKLCKIKCQNTGVKFSTRDNSYDFS